MAEFEIGCGEIVVLNPPPPRIVVEAPTAPTVVVDAPQVDVRIVNPAAPTITVEPLSSKQILVPMRGARGLKGDPGDPGMGGEPRFTYIDPIEPPDGSRTVFTVPFTYVLGSLAVYLNGLQEFYINELTSTTFSFDTAPISTDTIKVEFDALV